MASILSRPQCVKLTEPVRDLCCNWQPGISHLSTAARRPSGFWKCWRRSLDGFKAWDHDFGNKTFSKFHQCFSYIFGERLLSSICKNYTTHLLENLFISWYLPCGRDARQRFCGITAKGLYICTDTTKSLCWKLMSEQNSSHFLVISKCFLLNYNHYILIRISLIIISKSLIDLESASIGLVSWAMLTRIRRAIWPHQATINQWLLSYSSHLGPLLLTWFNFNPSMDK